MHKRTMERRIANWWGRGTQGVRDGDFDHLFPNAETKAMAIADLEEERNIALTLRLRADPEAVEYPDGRFAHIDVARREGMTPKLQ
jgi:hypothetical protein